MPLEIGGRRIGRRHPVFVIAEIGLNHGGDVLRAIELVEAAAWAGASAIKLQSLEAAQLVSRGCPAPAHVNATSLQEFFASFELDADEHRAVVTRARSHGLAVLSTPFSENVIPMLEMLELDAYKIASGDLTYDRLIVRAARTGRPLILSTGMSELIEVSRALQVATTAGASEMAVLHCVSAYPTPPDAENLRAIVTLAESTGVPTGLSDHGSGLLSAVAAVALGACIYERHLVLEADESAIDRAVSSTPSELRAIVAALGQTRAALGDGIKRCQPAERPNAVPSRRGLYAARTLAAGKRLTSADISVLRPASAVAPDKLETLVGSVLTRPMASGEAFVPADVNAGARA
jgi:N,N'-diacetyllegionaminate synthase